VTTASTGGSTSQIIDQAFASQGPSAVAWGQRVAACESGGSATAQNPSGATGLFQFMPSTFAATPQGQSGASITDPTASAQAAAYLYSQGQQAQWSCN
jgi:soluble lytic murein transglycosylase-like protein